MNRWLDFRPPGGGVAYLAAIFILAGTVFAINDGNSWQTRYAYPFLLPIGIGLWLKHSWARWTGFIFLAVMTGDGLPIFGDVPISGKSVFKLVAYVATLRILWKWDVYPAPEPADALPDTEHSDDEPSDTAGQSQNRFGDV